MSGPLEREYFSLGPALPGPQLLSPAEARKRVSAALLLSFLLHALLVLMPPLGKGAVPGASPARPAKVAGPAAVLDVRLERPPVPAQPAPRVPAPRAGDRLKLRLARGLDLLPVAGGDYFTTDQLTKRPLPTSQPYVVVPKRTARYVKGTVVLKLWINELGGVETVEMEKTDLPPAVVDVAAETFRKLHFVPGEIDGRRVGVLLRVEVSFDYAGGIRFLE